MSRPEGAVTRALATVCAVALALTVLGAATAGAQEPEPRFRALVFSKVTNFRHASIPAGIAAIQRLGQQHNFDVVATDDAGAFTDANLATFDVVVFNNTNSTPTSGDLLNAEQRAAFQRYIRAGGGYAGLHSATGSERDWEWYEDLVGAIFSNHPNFDATGGTFPGRIKVLDRAHPSTSGLPEIWERSEEWYNWTVNPTGKVHTLAQIKVRDGIHGLDEGVDHPYSWCQVFEGGRSWYTAGGHAASSFDEPLFLEHLRGGIEWAAGAVEGDCGASKDGSFEKVLLDDEVADPFELAVLPDRRVLYIQRTGQIKLIDQETLDVTVAGDLELGLSTARHSDGLIGLALDEDFADNGWFYILYSDPDVKRLNLSRLTLTGDTVDMQSERVLLEIPTWRDEALANVHMGGSLAMGPTGDLYAAIGDNTDPFESSGYAPIDERAGRRAFDAQATAGNTNDLRGKVLRITPTDDGGYTVPAGNLFAPGTAGTRAEIYAMGWRNPFRITVDPHDGALLVADYGPDARQPNPLRGPAGIVEWNRITAAGNYGWPYCIGNNIPYVDYDYATGQSRQPFDCANLVNDSPNNTGLTALPPAKEALVWYSYDQSAEFPELGTGGAGPMSGPVYDYDPNLDSPTKFPEYYDGKWINFEYTRNYYKVFSLYESDHTFQDPRFDPVSAGELLSINSFMRDTTFVAPFEAEFGPDGSLYVIDFGLGSGTGRGGSNELGGVYRIDYVVGNERPPVARATAEPVAGQPPLEVAFSSAGSFSPSGLALRYAWDFDDDGETDSTEPNPTHTYTANGEYTARLTVTDANGRSTNAIETVVVGNTEPDVAFDMPPDGGFFAFGDIIDYRVSVDDVEDGSTADGDIDCDQVTVSDQLGHDDHAHPLDRYSGCEGSIQTVTGDAHGPGQNLYYRLQASYTDDGGDGVRPLTGVAGVTLQKKDKEAEHFDDAGGVEILDRPGASGDRRVGEIEPNDWIAFKPVNLMGIDAVTLGVSSGGQGGTVEFRRDAPDGELLGSVEVENTGGWGNIVPKTVELDDPGVSFDLYLVFTNPDYDPAGQDLLSLDTVRFDGDGVGRRPCAEATAPDGFTPLWNGQNLDDWDYIGNGRFSVTDDCTLLSDGQAGLLWYTPQAFADFELALDYRLGNVDDNSGVFVRFPEPVDWQGPWSARPDDTVRGHEIQINDNPGGDPQKTGAVYNLARPTASASNPVGEWNRMRIRVRGQRYTVTVNGQVVNDVVSGAGRALSGHIGLQAHHVGSDVEFRDVAVRELELDTAAPVVDAITEPAEPGGDAGWHTGPVTVRVDAADPDDGAGAGSGVARVEVAVDGGGWERYDGPLTLAADGEHTVAYRATDSAGNVSEPAELSVRIDQTAPDVEISGVADGAVHGDSEELAIAADAADATSGVARRTLTVGGRTVAPGDRIALYRLPLGETTVEATATDAAGNTTTETLRFRVTTSFGDVDRLLDRFAGDDRLSAVSLRRLRAHLERARRGAERGRDAQVVAALDDFRALAGNEAAVPDAEVRGVLVRDADELIRLHGGGTG